MPFHMPFHVAAAAVLLICGASSVKISVDSASHQFIAPDGRVRLFHGVNVVQKAAPWHPVLDRFDASSSLATEDIANLKKWGLNVVRLGVMWPGVEPAEGLINATYLTVMRKLVDDLYAQGIHTIVDYHQDVLCPRFCGEGVPDWLLPKLEVPALTTNCGGFVPVVAKIIGICKPFADFHFDLDPATGYPRTDQCLSNPFTEYSETPEVLRELTHFPRTRSLTHSLTYTLAHSLTRSLAHSLTYAPAYPPVHTPRWSAPGGTS